MTVDPISILNSLLTARKPVDSNRLTVNGLEVYAIDDELSTPLAVSESFFEGDRRAAHGRVEADYHDRFMEAVNAIHTVWGPPCFQSIPVPSFPYTDNEPKSFEEDMYWRGAVALAYWRKAGHLAYVCVEHQDVELPYCFLLGTKPDGSYQAEPDNARESPS
ncbi:hypothetical protein [Rhodopirellula europaea]|uniref:hypothetical protein n=1 Tax=Rhodopirellula europaea TaxID=1263866 RepID=UPI003D2BF049|tara:strand:- start:24 stop:509 length:486 start_codon:yes stop_codon:yes gene_type:complete